jgi:hypothetical protein
VLADKDSRRLVHVERPLDVASAQGRQAEPVPEVNIPAAAEDLLTVVAAAEGITCGGESALLALAQVGARAMATRAEAGAAAGGPAE